MSTDQTLNTSDNTEQPTLETSTNKETPSRRKTIKETVKAMTAPLASIPKCIEEGKKIDLNDPSLYLNREMTWLSFNQRVLHEAEDIRTPLLERLKFIAIVSSNLDEFFMKRIGGLKHQVAADIQNLSIDGRTPQQQIDACYEIVKQIEFKKHQLLSDIIEQLKAEDIFIVSYQSLSKEQQQQTRDFYFSNIYPLLTPQGMDPAHPFPFLSNQSLNLLVSLTHPDDLDSIPLLARVKVPIGAGIKRFIKIGEENRFVPLEEVMANNLDLLFPNMNITHCELFRVTRNANTERDEETADDLLSMIESELRDRRFAPIVRLEIQAGMNATHRGMLAAELGLDEQADVSDVAGMLAMRDLFELLSLKGKKNSLHDQPHQPLDHPKLQDSPNIFHTIRENGAILLHHPYNSFSTTVERFLREASEDPKVRAIKMTLYRTSSDTKVIDYLMQAAKNGKQVAVVVELKARFDEAANIKWASRMEEAGVHVTYGVVGLKTHSKVILVIRQDFSFNKIQRYAHIGTGNYHAGTARLYADLGILTCDDEIGGDLTELFNYLTTGYNPKRNYQKILPSPKFLKKALLSKIDREIELHQKGIAGLIQFKMNALEDVDVTKALYKAAMAGVQIDLIIRDTCRFRPQLPNLSESARVISIAGRFLEHTRIYYFRNGGDEEYFIGSADAMQRNLESRVEVVTPVEDPMLYSELRMILNTQLNDQRSAWDMQFDGSYVQRSPDDEKAKGAQDSLISFYENRQKDISRIKKLKTGVKRKKRNG
jgi:polyphosphate kinase